MTRAHVEQEETKWAGRERKRNHHKTPNQKPKGSADETSKDEAEESREFYGEVLVWEGVEEEEHSWDAWGGDSEPGCVSPEDFHYFYFSSLEEFARAPRVHRPTLASGSAAHRPPCEQQFFSC